MVTLTYASTLLTFANRADSGQTHLFQSNEDSSQQIEGMHCSTNLFYICQNVALGATSIGQVVSPPPFCFPSSNPRSPLKPFRACFSGLGFVSRLDTDSTLRSCCTSMCRMSAGQVPPDLEPRNLIPLLTAIPCCQTFLSSHV